MKEELDSWSLEYGLVGYMVGYLEGEKSIYFLRLFSWSIGLMVTKS